MRIVVKGKNLEITPALRAYSEKKVAKLEKFFEDRYTIATEVMLSHEKERHIVEITMQVNGILLRGEERSLDMYASIDGAVDKIERQIHKYKTRINRKLQGGPKIAEIDVQGAAVQAPQEEEEIQPKIVRTKRFAVKPMNTEEAIMQMDLLGHGFFVFRNAETDEVNVVYKRNDGNYGLIEPTYE